VVGLRCLVAALLAAGVLLVGAPGWAAGTAGADVDLGGTPLTAVSTDPADPTPVEAGLWSDVLSGGAGGAPHQLVYRRTMAGSQVHVGVTGVPGTTEVEGLEITTGTATGDSTDCASATDSSSYGARAPFGVSVVVGASEPGQQDVACRETEEVRIVLGRGTFASDVDLPIALRVVEEAPAEAGDPDAFDAEGDPPLARRPEPGQVEATDGATAFLDAPELGSGTWSDAVPIGGVALYRVRLDRGQSLAVGVQVASKDPDAEEALGFSSPGVELGLVDPTRTLGQDVLGDSVTSTTYADPGADQDVLVDGLPPVSWLRGFDSEIASLPGDYWVVLAVDAVDDLPAPLSVPVEITLEVEGEAGPGPGAPAYPEVVTGPGGTAGPEGYAAATPYLVGPDEFAAEVAADPGAPALGGGGGDGRSVVRTTGGAALGVAGLMCLAGGAVLLRRRGRTA